MILLLIIWPIHHTPVLISPVEGLINRVSWIMIEGLLVQVEWGGVGFPGNSTQVSLRKTYCFQRCIFQLVESISFLFSFPSDGPIVRWSPFSQLLNESRDVEGPKHFDAAQGRCRCHGVDGGVVQGGVGTEPGYAKGLPHAVACPSQSKLIRYCMPYLCMSIFGTQQNTLRWSTWTSSSSRSRSWSWASSSLPSSSSSSSSSSPSSPQQQEEQERNALCKITLCFSNSPLFWTMFPTCFQAVGWHLATTWEPFAIVPHVRRYVRQHGNWCCSPSHLRSSR